MSFTAIHDLIDKHFPEVIVGVEESSSPPALIIRPESIVDISQLLFENESTYFDMLSCITGIDNGPEDNTMEVVYNLYSIPYEHHFMLRATLSRDKPAIDSVHKVWKAALWHEREAFDLLGIYFNEHPDLRRILLPADWEGHPLKKDYKHQEYYRGIKVEY